MQRRGDFTQSLMELGAVVCLPNGVPRCDICPVHFLCRAFCHNTQLAYPKKEEKPERKKQEKTVLLMHCRNKTAIHKREHGELLAGLWEFPNMEGKRTADEIRKWLEDMGVTTEDICFLAVRKHIFTHIEWRMHTYLLRCKEEKGPFVWVTKEQLEEEITLPTAFKKLLSLLDQQD